MDGLYSVLQQYTTKPSPTNDSYNNKNNNSTRPSLPKYLIILDDDTYMNMTYITDIRTSQYPYDDPYIRTGCLLRFKTTGIIFHYPFGGFASIFTRKVIENFIQPIYCNTKSMEYKKGITNHKGFNHKACWRINQDLIGERSLFRDGMSVLDLMYTFSTNFPFTKVDEWTNGTGYCFVSDQALAYFFGFYYIGVPDQVWSSPSPETDSRNHRGYSYNYLTEAFPTCQNMHENCGNSTTICHYNTREQMYDMYNKENPIVLQ